MSNLANVFIHVKMPSEYIWEIVPKHVIQATVFALKMNLLFSQKFHIEILQKLAAVCLIFPFSYVFSGEQQ